MTLAFLARRAVSTRHASVNFLPQSFAYSDRLSRSIISVPYVKLSAAQSRLYSLSMALTNGHSNTADLQSHIEKMKLTVPDLPDVPGLNGVPLYPQYNPVDLYRAYIISELHKITGAEPDVIDKALQWAQTLSAGDLVLPTPALRLKGKKPDELANEIAQKFPESSLVETPPLVEKTFVRFFFKPTTLAKLTLPTILKQKDTYGFNPLLGLEDPSQPQTSRKKRMIVEFSAPNIAKEFHTGHLRSTIIGGFLCKLYERVGWEVISMNYLGDWGKQYGVLSLGFKRFGSEEELHKDPIRHLNDVYVKINKVSYEEQKPVKVLGEQINELKKLKNPPPKKKPAKGQPEPPAPPKWMDEQEAELKAKEAEITKLQKELIEKPSIDEQARQFFKRMVDGDEEAVSNWQRFRELSINRYIEMYERLNIKFDDYSGESTVKQEDMDKAARIMEEKGISEHSDGAVIVDFEKHKQPKLGKALVKKRDGTSLYLTRDIAANYERYEKYHFDRMIYVIADQQRQHIEQFFKILELMGPPYSDVIKKCEHVSFGMVKDPEGATMSTRKGNVVSLNDSLDQVGEFMHDVMKNSDLAKDKYDLVEDPAKTADTLGMTSVMVQDYSGKRINGYSFSLKAMTSFEGDTGPYLQYAHARLCSVKRRVSIPEHELLDADMALITAKEGIEVLRSLAQWPDVVVNTLKTQEPVTVLTYLFKLTHLLSSAYDAKSVKTENGEEAKDDQGRRVTLKSMSVVYAESEEKKRALMALYESARIVLNNGMKLLGLNPVERM